MDETWRMSTLRNWSIVDLILNTLVLALIFSHLSEMELPGIITMVIFLSLWIADILALYGLMSRNVNFLSAWQIIFGINLVILGLFFIGSLVALLSVGHFWLARWVSWQLSKQRENNRQLKHDFQINKGILLLFSFVINVYLIVGSFIWSYYISHYIWMYLHKSKLSSFHAPILVYNESR